jgi:hypothetical protein
MSVTKEFAVFKPHMGEYTNVSKENIITEISRIACEFYKINYNTSDSLQDNITTHVENAYTHYMMHSHNSPVTVLLKNSDDTVSWKPFNIIEIFSNEELETFTYEGDYISSIIKNLDNGEELWSNGTWIYTLFDDEITKLKSENNIESKYSEKIKEQMISDFQSSNQEN